MTVHCSSPKVEKLEGMLEGWEHEVEEAKRQASELEAHVADLQDQLEAAQKAASRHGPELEAAKKQARRGGPGDRSCMEGSKPA